jgi:hypothetical protein
MDPNNFNDNSEYYKGDFQYHYEWPAGSSGKYQPLPSHGNIEDYERLEDQVSQDKWVMSRDMFEFLRYLKEENKMSWEDMTKRFNEEFGWDINHKSLGMKYSRAKDVFTISLFFYLVNRS